jgi:hypothetical protein
VLCLIRSVGARISRGLLTATAGQLRDAGTADSTIGQRTERSLRLSQRALGRPGELGWELWWSRLCGLDFLARCPPSDDCCPWLPGSCAWWLSLISTAVFDASGNVDMWSLVVVVARCGRLELAHSWLCDAASINARLPLSPAVSIRCLYPPSQRPSALPNLRGDAVHHHGLARHCLRTGPATGQFNSHAEPERVQRPLPMPAYRCTDAGICQPCSVTLSPIDFSPSLGMPDPSY